MRLGANVTGVVESKGSLFRPTPTMLMLACLIFGLLAQFSHQWLAPDETSREEWRQVSYGLREYAYDDWNSEDEALYKETHSYKASLDECIEYMEAFLAVECTQQHTIYRAGILASLLLAVGSVSALCWLVIEARRPPDQDFQSTILARIAGGATLLAPFVWYLWLRFAVVDMPWNYPHYGLGYGFNLAVVGGLLGLISIRQYSRKWDTLRENSNLTYAKIAVVAITLSMFMPYLVVGVGISGATMADFMLWISVDQIIEFIVNLFRDSPVDITWVTLSGVEDSITEEGGGFGVVLLIILFLFSPLFFMTSALLACYSMYSEGTVPKGIGVVHLIYFFSIFILLEFYSSPMSSSIYPSVASLIFNYFGILPNYTPFITFSLGGVLGFGFWVGGLSGFGFIYRSGGSTATATNTAALTSNDAVYQHYLRQLIAQGYDEATAEKHAKEYEENYTKQQ